MYRAYCKKHTLRFKRPSGTSRGVLTEKDTWYIFLYKKKEPQHVGIGECSTIKGLSMEAGDNYEEMLKAVCSDINVHIDNGGEELNEWPSIRFGIETALRDLENGCNRVLFPSEFTEGVEAIPINGLIWMGEIDFMRKEISAKLDEGFRCIKIKVGNKEFEDELKLLEVVRNAFSPESLDIRLDANGAFKPADALYKLEQLAEYNIHSVEQPIRQGRWTEMEILCRESPIPIALDEELIGKYERSDREMLVSYIRPQYLIFKPSLLGGFRATEEWIEIANKYDADWWITSALESNIGLNAIAQWTYTLKIKLPQGLGTGQLYTNNIPSPLIIDEASLWYKNGDWDLTSIA